MKKTMKKGFTLVELLFVMAIISILAGFAIANLKNSTAVATQNSLKNDAKNAISLQNTYFASNQAYDEASGTGDPQGILVGTNGTKFTVSKGNSLTTEGGDDCGDGTVGFTVAVTNATLPTSSVNYASCTDGFLNSGGNSVDPSTCPCGVDSDTGQCYTRC